MDDEVRSQSGHRAAIAVLVCAALTVLVGCTDVEAELKAGLQAARQSSEHSLTNLPVTAQKTAWEVPTSLQKALDDAVSAGSLSADEEALVREGNDWVSYYKSVNDYIGIITQWQLSVPDDAVRLAAAQLSDNTSDAFRKYVSDLEQKVLTSLACKAADIALDSQGQAQSDQVTPTYDSTIGTTPEEVSAYIKSSLTQWINVEKVLNIQGLAASSLENANRYITSINRTLTSPSGVVAAANLIYFRSCVATK